MNPIWIFIITSLLIQEPASIGATIFLIRENAFDVGLANFIWVLATSIDTAAGYGLGVLVQHKFPDARFVRWTARRARAIEERIGDRGTNIAALLLGFVSVPYANGFLFAWLKLSFARSFTLILVGNALYWGVAWVLAIGIRDVVNDWRVGFSIVVIAGLIISLLARLAWNALKRK